MSLLVLDASVAVKWFLLAQEPLKFEALDLLQRSRNGLVEFLVPDAFWAEVGNVLCKAVRQGRCSPLEAKDSIRALQEFDLVTVPSSGLLLNAFAIAHDRGRSFYESLYIALALSQQATLVTADERLANALAARFPVKWLGAFSIT